MLIANLTHPWNHGDQKMNPDIKTASGKVSSSGYLSWISRQIIFYQTLGIYHH